MSREAMKLALEALDGIYRYGLDTLSGRSDGLDDRDWQRAGVNEMTKRARLGLTALQKALAEQPHEPKKFNPNESFEREEAAVARVREFMRNH